MQSDRGGEEVVVTLERLREDDVQLAYEQGVSHGLPFSDFLASLANIFVALDAGSQEPSEATAREYRINAHDGIYGSFGDRQAALWELDKHQAAYDDNGGPRPPKLQSRAVGPWVDGASAGSFSAATNARLRAFAALTEGNLFSFTDGGEGQDEYIWQVVDAVLDAYFADQSPASPTSSEPQEATRDLWPPVDVHAPTPSVTLEEGEPDECDCDPDMRIADDCKRLGCREARLSGMVAAHPADDPDCKPLEGEQRCGGSGRLPRTNQDVLQAHPGRRCPGCPDCSQPPDSLDRGGEAIPREYWREVPCGHPPDPVAVFGRDGEPVCHCGTILDQQDGIEVDEAPGPVVHCQECGCGVAIPPRPDADCTCGHPVDLHDALGTGRCAVRGCGCSVFVDCTDQPAPKKGEGSGEKYCQCHHKGGPDAPRCEACPKDRSGEMKLKITDTGDPAGMNDQIYAHCSTPSVALEGDIPVSVGRCGGTGEQEIPGGPVVDCPGCAECPEEMGGPAPQCTDQPAPKEDSEGDEEDWHVVARRERGIVRELRGTLAAADELIEELREERDSRPTKEAADALLDALLVIALGWESGPLDKLVDELGGEDGGQQVEEKIQSRVEGLFGRKLVASRRDITDEVETSPTSAGIDFVRDRLRAAFGEEDR